MFGIHLGELEQVLAVVAGSGVVVGGCREPEIRFPQMVLRTVILAAASPDVHATRDVELGSTMTAPYRPISTCRSPCVPL